MSIPYLSEVPGWLQARRSYHTAPKTSTLPIPRSNSFGGHHRFTASPVHRFTTLKRSNGSWCRSNQWRSISAAGIRCNITRKASKGQAIEDRCCNYDVSTICFEHAWMSLHVIAFHCIYFPFHLALLAPFWPSSHCPWSPNPAMGPWIRGPVADHQSPGEFWMRTKWDKMGGGGQTQVTCGTIEQGFKSC